MREPYPDLAPVLSEMERLADPSSFAFAPEDAWMRLKHPDYDELRRMLALFTLLPLAEIDDLLDEHAVAPPRRVAQRALARAVTELVHGPEATQAAEQATDILFGGDPRQAPPAALAAVAAEVPATSLEAGEELGAGVDLVPVLVRTGLARSQSDARRQLEQGGLSVNGEKAGPDRRLGSADLLHGRWVLLRKGKKGWAVLDAQPRS